MQKLLSEENLSFLDKCRQRRIIRKIKTIDKLQWTGMEHTFNRWEWPRQLWQFIPPWWLDEKLPRKAYVFLRPICDLLKSTFTDKERSRYHNVIMGRMTEGEFEYWYENLSLVRGDEKTNAAYYDKVNFMEQLEWWKDDVFAAIQQAVSQIKAD